MARYADLPAEMRLKIMENLIDDGDKGSLYALLQSSPTDYQLFNQFRQPLLRRLAIIKLDALCEENWACRHLIMAAAIMLAKRHQPPFNRQFYDVDDIASLYNDMYMASEIKPCLDDPASLHYLLRLLVVSPVLLEYFNAKHHWGVLPTNLHISAKTVYWVWQAMGDLYPWWWTWTEEQHFKTALEAILEQTVVEGPNALEVVIAVEEMNDEEDLVDTDSDTPEDESETDESETDESDKKE